MSATPKPHKAMVVFGMLAAAAALVEMFSSSEPATWLTSAAMLCFSWSMVFVPPPHVNPTLKDIYQASRRGWRMSISERLVTILGLLLFVAGMYLRYR